MIGLTFLLHLRFLGTKKDSGGMSTFKRKKSLAVNCILIILSIFFSATKEAIPAEERLSQLLERLESLEYRLNTESRQKTELADEVAQLREENQRLQEESATAAQQLRRFTEWFFQTIEKA